MLLNEKNPGLFIELAADLSIKAEHQLDFAQDYSGLAHDSLQDRFWILSHEDSMLYLWDRDEGGVSFYKVPYAKVEGVAINQSSSRLYIVSETGRTLYAYALTTTP